MPGWAGIASAIEPAGGVSPLRGGAFSSDFCGAIGLSMLCRDKKRLNGRIRRIERRKIEF
jgi:hypothetical protein